MRHSILFVDDDVQLRRLCKIALEESDYLVSEAGNGTEALDAIQKATFDLVVLDLSMPDVDGFEFLKAVRDTVPKLKIVVISGFLGGSMLTAAKLFGAAATLAKPFSTDSLLLAVESVLVENAPGGAPL
jgi:DNA-binding NtrC family response regulator